MTKQTAWRMDVRTNGQPLRDSVALSCSRPLVQRVIIATSQPVHRAAAVPAEWVRAHWLPLSRAV